MQTNWLLPVFCSIMIPLSPVYHDWSSKTIQAALLVYLMSPLPLVSFERGEFQRFGGIFLFYQVYLHEMGSYNTQEVVLKMLNLIYICPCHHQDLLRGMLTVSFEG